VKNQILQKNDANKICPKPLKGCVVTFVSLKSNFNLNLICFVCRSLYPFRGLGCYYNWF